MALSGIEALGGAAVRLLVNEDFRAWGGNGCGIEVVGPLQIFMGGEATISPAAAYNVGCKVRMQGQLTPVGHGEGVR